MQGGAFVCILMHSVVVYPILIYDVLSEIDCKDTHFMRNDIKTALVFSVPRILPAVTRRSFHLKVC